MYGYVKVSLIELFNYKNGYTPSTTNPEFWTNGDLPWFRMDDIRENGRILSDAQQHVTHAAIKGNLFPKNSIIVSTSATIGEHALITVSFLVNQRFTCLSPKDEWKSLVEMKYLFYCGYKLGQYCKENLNVGNFASVDMRKFDKFEFYIPSIEKQKEIVSILDKFSSLCDDISGTLPESIRKHHERYEYYRDKLLDFKRKE